MTAKDLLYKILDYQCMWIDTDNKKSKPAKLRLQQIEALLDAFELSKKYVNPLVQIKYYLSGNKESLSRAQQLNKLSHLDYVLHGEFLHDREEAADNELSQKIRNTLLPLFPFMEDRIQNRPSDIGWLFNNLFHFRKDIYKLTNPNGGMLEGFSAGLHYSFYLQDKLKTIILDNLEEIDDTLWLILDPTKRNIELTTLESQYKYADHDFDAIDLEWRIENY